MGRDQFGIDQYNSCSSFTRWRQRTTVLDVKGVSHVGIRPSHGLILMSGGSAPMVVRSVQSWWHSVTPQQVAAEIMRDHQQIAIRGLNEDFSLPFLTITDPPPHLTLASRAKVFGMRVLGYRRRDLPLPDGVDRMYCTDRGETINPILEQCDVLALVLNLSDATYRLIGRAELARMKPSAIIVNLARGGLIDEAALIDALESGRLGGAVLDVTETEPLPSSSPLWTTRNTLITPHFTAAMPDKSERSLDRALRCHPARYQFFLSDCSFPVSHAGASQVSSEPDVIM